MESFNDLIMAPIYKIDLTRLLNGLNIIEKSTHEQLRSVPFLESIICGIGLHNDPSISMNYGEEYQKYLTQHGLIQQPRQLADALVFLSDKNIRSYVEVGTFNGICTGLITGYLTRFNPDFVCTTIDITERYHNDYRAEMEKRFNIFFQIEDSKKVFAENNDLVFIDADHNYSSVRSDYEQIGKTAKFCMFHDIVDSWQQTINDGGSLRYWEELKKGKKYYEFTYNPTKDKYFGIGIIDQR